MLRKTDHFRVQVLPSDTKKEVEEALAKDDVRTITPLNRQFIEYFSRECPFVRNASELSGFPAALEKTRGETGFSILFCPHFIDESCSRGIFPLTLEVGRNIYVYGPKLHRARALTRLTNPGETVRGMPLSSDDSEGVFQVSRFQVSKKFLRSSQANVSFDVFVNRMEDLAPVLDLIRRQHGENWMCSPLRACLVHMFANREAFKTKVVVTAVRRHQKDGVRESGLETHSSSSKWIEPGELVAGEVGFLVGDTYCSATGAYNCSSAGTVQLAVVGTAMKNAGCKLWDLGMHMDYKERAIGTVQVNRKAWCKLIEQRVASPSTPTSAIDAYLTNNYHRGVCVQELLHPSSSSTSLSNNNEIVSQPKPTITSSAPGEGEVSKSMKKKIAKAAFLAQKKANKSSTLEQ